MSIYRKETTRMKEIVLQPLRPLTDVQLKEHCNPQYQLMSTAMTGAGATVGLNIRSQLCPRASSEKARDHDSGLPPALVSSKLGAQCHHG